MAACSRATVAAVLLELTWYHVISLQDIGERIPEQSAENAQIRSMRTDQNWFSFNWWGTGRCCRWVEPAHSTATHQEKIPNLSPKQRKNISENTSPNISHHHFDCDHHHARGPHGRHQGTIRSPPPFGHLRTTSYRFSPAGPVPISCVILGPS
jgi:hypothetical protein